jgi:hypothetical protein
MTRRIDSPRSSAVAALAVVPVILAVTLGLLAPPATAADPPNTNPSGLRHCSTQGAVSKACLRGALKDYARARAREGLAPMTLPRNFTALSVPGQLMVLADLDRVDRGLTPVAGLSSALDTYAQTGARNHGDPAFPSWTREGGSNWASPASALWSEFLWMYDDGPGAGNLDCPSAGSSGCYGHRHNILARYHAPLLMGAGVDAQGGATQLFLGMDRHDRADVLTWAKERALIPLGVSRHRLKHGGTVRVWASGSRMNVRAAVTRGYRLDHKRCHLKAGHACTLRVSGHGHGRLTLRGPHGKVVIRLR